MVVWYTGYTTKPLQIKGNGGGDVDIKEERIVYIRNRKLLKELRQRYLKAEISKQQFLTLRGQAISGDANGAVIGLEKILKDVKRS